MKTQRRILVAIICAVAVLASVIGAGAQATPEKTARVESHSFGFVTGGTGGGTIGGQGDNTFVFVSSEMSIDGKVVTGAPYSAQAVTESVQTLAGGNRIVRRSTASVYRDSEGRTRREQTINVVGAYAALGEPPQTVFINDPVARVNYILESRSRTARKIDLSNMAGAAMPARAKDPLAGAAEPGELKPARKKVVIDATRSEGAESGVSSEQRQRAAEMKAEMARSEVEARAAGPGAIFFERSFGMGTNSKNAKKESLGKQTIEGVEAEGTRLTATIPVGEIGNEQPIDIVSESWYSAELQTVVMSRHSDPRMGETTYRLTNINRSEPAHSLFEVPSDYTIKETVPPGMQYKLRVEKEVRKPGSEKQDQ
jgi:hypothetical protein